MNLKLTTSVDMNTYYMPTKMKYKSSGVMSLLQRICTFFAKKQKKYLHFSCISINIKYVVIERSPKQLSFERKLKKYLTFKT